MKTRFILFFAGLLLLGGSTVSCNRNPQGAGVAKQDAKAEVTLQDFGPEPTVLDIDDYTMSNDNFRLTLWTGANLQVALMSILPGGEIGVEQHPDGDQFLRIEDGKASVLMGDSRDSLTFSRAAEKDFAIMIPAGKWHNIINTGDKPLKLYSIYAPVEHPRGTVHRTFEEAAEADAHH